MSIRAYELMKLSRVKPNIYSNKTYNVTFGSAINYKGKEVDSFGININGEFVEISHAEMRIYISTNTEVEEIQCDITCQEALEMWARSKEIICKVDDIIYNFKDRSIFITPKMITDGKWYKV